MLRLYGSFRLTLSFYGGSGVALSIIFSSMAICERRQRVITGVEESGSSKDISLMVNRAFRSSTGYSHGLHSILLLPSCSVYAGFRSKKLGSTRVYVWLVLCRREHCRRAGRVYACFVFCIDFYCSVARDLWCQLVISGSCDSPVFSKLLLSAKAS